MACELLEGPALDPGRLEFVCSGNLCRSPFAEGVARSLGAPPSQARSSGIWAPEGAPCPSPAVEAAARFGVDLAGHRSRCTSAEDLRAAATVAVMEFAHLRAVRALLPAVGGPEVVLLGSFAPGPGVEIPDPYGRRPAEYLEVYRVIHAAVRVLLQFDG